MLTTDGCRDSLAGFVRRMATLERFYEQFAEHRRAWINSTF
jgi:hypothetical protein